MPQIGEISYALEKVFGRYQENLNITKGVYKKVLAIILKLMTLKKALINLQKKKGVNQRCWLLSWDKMVMTEGQR